LEGLWRRFIIKQSKKFRFHFYSNTFICQCKSYSFNGRSVSIILCFAPMLNVRIFVHWISYLDQWSYRYVVYQFHNFLLYSIKFISNYLLINLPFKIDLIVLEIMWTFFKFKWFIFHYFKFPNKTCIVLIILVVKTSWAWRSSSLKAC
jgi:hypothetical protein